MEITYQVADGYCGGSRPQHVKIPDSEITECESNEEALQIIEDAIQEHFEQNISPSYDVRAILEDVRQLRESYDGQ